MIFITSLGVRELPYAPIFKLEIVWILCGQTSCHEIPISKRLLCGYVD